MTDYRREVTDLLKKIIEENGISVSQLARSLEVSDFAVRRWISGSNLPVKSNFNKLKAISEGKHYRDNQEPQSVHGFSPLEGKLIDVLLTLPGRMDQLTKQIADLQAENGKLAAKMSSIESNFFEKAGHRKQP